MALYLLLLSAIGCALPLAATLVSPLGWFMIGVFLATFIFNNIILAYYVAVHLRLFFKRHLPRLKKCFSSKNRKLSQMKNEANTAVEKPFYSDNKKQGDSVNDYDEN